MMLSRERALRIIQKYISRQVPKDLELRDGIPEGCILYGVSDYEPCWSVLILSEESRTGPSRIICVSKKSAKIIYDGPTNGE
ncbi:MAG: hypothetical protein CVU54_14415 [Deltaproteobacteria bacterium HGW-Deltaproteobacteria-12]|jgi:hypothetical protein|nr:MAG: hypothetical protein CVU54_14415 [Deltaproteobacteria bacterium HGW-Deltaproteobacteria-12]